MHQEHLRSWFRLLDAGGDVAGTPAAEALAAQVEHFIKVTIGSKLLLPRRRRVALWYGLTTAQA